MSQIILKIPPKTHIKENLSDKRDSKELNQEKEVRAVTDLRKV